MNDFKRKRRKRIHAKAAEKYTNVGFLCATLRGFTRRTLLAGRSVSRRLAVKKFWVHLIKSGTLRSTYSSVG